MAEAGNTAVEGKSDEEERAPEPEKQPEEEDKGKSKSKAPRVRRRASKRRNNIQLEDDPEYSLVAEQYTVLVSYCQQLMRLNPGTTAIIKSSTVDGKRLFERVYMCMEACRSGFKACRPIIGLKTCNLTGYCRGVLLTAIGLDADNSMFPIAFAVCEKESAESWDWFINLMKEDLEVVDTKKFMVISNGRKELDDVLASVFEGAEIRICLRHLHASFREEFPGLLMKQMMWACAKATTPVLFKRKMDELKAVNEKAYEWLMEKNPSKWSRSHFSRHSKCDMLVNVPCEDFISAISEVRDKPIITLLEYIRFWLMSRFNRKRESASECRDPVGKRIMKVIEKNEEVARHCYSTRAATYIFQVNFGSKAVAVNLAERICSCRMFDFTGIPCGHALAAIWAAKLNVMDYVDEAYKKERLLVQWAKSITPMPSPDKWPNLGKNPIYPPVGTGLPGTLEKSRKRDSNELVGSSNKRRRGQPHHCSNCRERGHSKITCKNPAYVKVDLQPVTKKRMGRPPKAILTPDTIKRNERRLRQKAREEAQAQVTICQRPDATSSRGSLADTVLPERPNNNSNNNNNNNRGCDEPVGHGTTLTRVVQPVHCGNCGQQGHSRITCKNPAKVQPEAVNHGTTLTRVGQLNRCGNCGQEGHSRITCQNPTTVQAVTKKRMGRPPKETDDPDTRRRNEQRRQKAREATLAEAARNPGPQASPSQGPQVISFWRSQT